MPLNYNIPDNVYQLGQTNKGGSGSGFGWVELVIQGLVTIAPFVAQMFHKNKDQWSSWNWGQKEMYVRQSLYIATTAVLARKANTVEEAMRMLIAKVEHDEDWEKWKQLNPAYFRMIQEAQNEVDRAKQGYKGPFTYIPLQTVDKYVKTAGILNLSNPFTWVAIATLTLTGLYFYKKKEERRRLNE